MESSRPLLALLVRSLAEFAAYLRGWRGASLGGALPPLTVTLLSPRVAARWTLAMVGLTLVVLGADARGADLPAQVLAGGVVWAIWFWLLGRECSIWRRALVFATAFVLLVEILLSMVLGWYEYRLDNVPAYVPPGHVLMFLFGVMLAEHTPRPLIAATPWLVGGYGAWATLSGIAPFDGAAAALYLWLFRGERARPVCVAMMWLALALELLGTGVGAWQWAPTIPYLGLETTNPPLLVGVFYAIYDRLVLFFARFIAGRVRHGAAAEGLGRPKTRNPTEAPCSETP